LGLIIKAAKQGRIAVEKALDLLRAIPETTTLHIGRDLIEACAGEVKASIGERE